MRGLREDEFNMPKRRVTTVVLKKDETLEVVRQRYEVNGWDFEGFVHAQNMGPMALFSKPESAPDQQPFSEPNVKL